MRVICIADSSWYCEILVIPKLIRIVSMFHVGTSNMSSGADPRHTLAAYCDPVLASTLMT